MKRYYAPLILFILLILEGTAVNFLPSLWADSGTIITPHWLLIVLVFMAMFYDFDYTYFCVIYAAIFGFLFDLVYTDVLGVYMFMYGIVIYIIHGIKRMLHTNIFVALLHVTIAVTLADAGVYLLYSFIGEAEMVWQNYLLVRLVPTLLANLVFALIAYPFLYERLDEWGEEHLSTKKTV
ncbi:cell shape-determining protein [Pontibacillus halophilus JSM 076056 = DSM 19796]|uniref:Cell shape-determining protein n=1 Tax=Pontibacillus halophilus JSM 076056 = DSM 19796 TaxID=1385510 RepID=A0A0A5GQH7_9BACI|nr:rod shape-determining protein MreD [Pontibacillus halophilus]KGX93483.1 cell shape-determining protein [Pontibacillus halophilus JSM 076056 = DSM 19796]